jgi:hypothetical protein
MTVASGVHLVRASLLACLLLSLTSSVASSQNQMYRNVTALSGRQTVLTMHFSLNKDCSRAPAPQIRFVTLPRHGTVLIRRATARADRVPGCRLIEAPLRAVTYYSSTGYLGEDKVAYEVRGADGSTETNMVTITVVPEPKDRPRRNRSDSIDL